MSRTHLLSCSEHGDRSFLSLALGTSLIHHSPVVSDSSLNSVDSHGFIGLKFVYIMCVCVFTLYEFI